jgi:hypothetical protein
VLPDGACKPITSNTRSFFAADRKRMLCLYHAPDAESVRLVQRDPRFGSADGLD